MEFEPNGTHCYIILQNGIRIGSFHLCDKGQWKLAQDPAVMFDFETMKAVTQKHEELVNQPLNPYHSSRMDQPDGDLLPVHLIPKVEEYYQETKVPHPDDA